MKPLNKLNEATLASGELLELWERDSQYSLLLDGIQVASSFSHGSDDSMAELATAPVRRANQPTFLIGGLALGFQLAALIAENPKEKANFVVAEPSPALVEWQSKHLDSLHPGLMHDPRVTVESRPVLQVARKSSKNFHAILLRSLHDRCQMSVAEASDYSAALKQGGLLLILLARKDTRLERTLQRAAFDVSTCSVPANHKGKQTRFHTIVLARKGRFVPFANR
jgi:spermidine synthase